VPNPVPARLDLSGVTAGYGNRPVLRDIDLTVQPGELLALLGPSGCGKTTLLRCVAGLEPVTSGTIRIGEVTVSAPGRAVVPERRGVGMVFQDGALFPHLTVARNVGYSLRRAQNRDARVRELLELVGLADYGDRLPGTLSGGQQQRVAIARALAPSPTVLLFDEPFSSLDAALRVKVRTEVRRLLDEVGVTSVFVTHDREEAFALGHRVGVMREGVLEQVATPVEVYEQPVSAWVAGFVGEANILAGDAQGELADTAIGRVPLLGRSAGPVQVLCRPEQLELLAGSNGQAGGARVESVEYHGRDSRCEVRLGTGELVTARLPGEVLHRAGDEVLVRHKGAPCTSWPAAR
jgi:iron(III) transport system ATP-binding protein